MPDLGSDPALDLLLEPRTGFCSDPALVLRPDKIRSAMTVTASAIRTARRVDRFTYAIRNIVAEAKKVEAAGKKVRYLNIGDPNQFGFLTPPHLVAAVEKAMRDGHNGYVPSPGIPEAREAAAADFVARGVKVSADRVLIT